MRDVQRQQWQGREDRNAQQLTFENQRMVQEYEARWKRKQLEAEGRTAKTAAKVAGAREKHEMKMTELKTQRGNIIGQVNLEELRRWQESERMVAGIRGSAPVVQGRLLA
jgi:hypothetical protein